MNEVIDYDFYRFSRLVIDLIINENGFEIPYDIEMEIIIKYYSNLNYTIECANPYEEQLEFILGNKQLLLDLQASNEGY